VAAAEAVVVFVESFVAAAVVCVVAAVAVAEGLERWEVTGTRFHHAWLERCWASGSFGFH